MDRDLVQKGRSPAIARHTRSWSGSRSTAVCPRGPDPARPRPGDGRDPGGVRRRLARPVLVAGPEPVRRLDAPARRPRLLSGGPGRGATPPRRHHRDRPERLDADGRGRLDNDLATRDQLDRGFRRLKPDQRAVLVLRHARPHDRGDRRCHGRAGRHGEVPAPPRDQRDACRPRATRVPLWPWKDRCHDRNPRRRPSPRHLVRRRRGGDGSHGLGRVGRPGHGHHDAGPAGSPSTAGCRRFRSVRWPFACSSWPRCCSRRRSPRSSS